ncbi:MAG: cell division protein FtsQ/DivIB [Candidatus Omnitrophica bacterium]|nr:cell division protein FtsQ/DivIB [Candidatus Omnitrophota bacterium]
MGKRAIKTKKTERAKRGESKLPIKKMTAVALIATFCIAVVASLYFLYFKSPYFIVSDLIVTGKSKESSINYNDLENRILDKNIFMLNIKELREYMLDRYKEILDIELTKAFPNAVTAAISLREPIAQLYKLYYYPVDKDGVILSGVKDLPDGKLPVISGINFDLSKRIGQQAGSQRLKKAIELLQEINASGILREHKLVEIDISNERNAIIFLEDGLEIKIGHQDFAPRLASLKNILQDPRIRPTDIRYIDLRFKEPVIGPRWKR